jgi:hypothetical protein
MMVFSRDVCANCDGEIKGQVSEKVIFPSFCCYECKMAYMQKLRQELETNFDQPATLDENKINELSRRQADVSDKRL